MAHDAINRVIAREAARIEEDSLCASKSQWNEGARWSKFHYRIGIPATIAAAAAPLLGTNNYSGSAATLGILSAILVGLLTFLKPTEKAAAHQAAGGKYDALRVRARQLKEFALIQGEIELDGQERLKVLTALREELNSNSPQPSPGSWEKAKKGIAAGEANHQVDQESD